MRQRRGPYRWGWWVKGRRGGRGGVIEECSDGSATRGLGDGRGGIIYGRRWGGRERRLMTRQGRGACDRGVEDSISYWVEARHLSRRLLEWVRLVVVGSERTNKDGASATSQYPSPASHILFRAPHPRGCSSTPLLHLSSQSFLLKVSYN